MDIFLFAGENDLSIYFQSSSFFIKFFPHGPAAYDHECRVPT